MRARVTLSLLECVRWYAATAMTVRVALSLSEVWLVVRSPFRRTWRGTWRTYRWQPLRTTCYASTLDPTKKTSNNAIDENIGHLDDENDMADLEGLEGIKIRNAHASASDLTKKTKNHSIDDYIGHFDIKIVIADLKGLEGMKVGNITSQADCSVCTDSPDVIVLNSGRHLKVMFFRECLSVQFPTFLNGNGEEPVAGSVQTKTQRNKNPNASSSAQKLRVACSPLQAQGMNKEDEKFFYMTVYVRTISGKTISIKCDKRQGITRIKDEIERKTKIPKAVQHLVSQGKSLSGKKTIEESNTSMTLRLQGGTKEDEMMTSARTSEDRNMRRKRSERSEIGDVQHTMPQGDQKKKWKVWKW